MRKHKIMQSSIHTQIKANTTNLCDVLHTSIEDHSFTITGETAWVLETLPATPEDWVYRIIGQLEKDGTTTPEIYTPEGFRTLEMVTEKIADKMYDIVDRIRTFLDENGLG